MKKIENENKNENENENIKKNENENFNNYNNNQIINNITINNITNTTHNTIINESGCIINNYNSINNLKINCLGDEDTSYITNDFLNKVIKNPFIGIPKLVELIHFNPEHPENNNIKIINKKEPYLDYFNGNVWKTANKSKVISDVIISKNIITDKHLNNLDDSENSNNYKKYSEAVKYFVNNFVIDNYSTKPSYKELKKIYKDLEKDIYSLILNHKKNINDKYLID